MKQIFLLFFFFIFSLFFIYILNPHKEYDFDIIDLLPSDTILVIEWRDESVIREIYDFLHKDNIKNSFTSPTYHYFENYLNTSSDDNGKKHEISEIFNTLNYIFSIKKLPPHKKVIAFFHKNNEKNNENSYPYFLNYVLFFNIENSSHDKQNEIASLFGNVIYFNEKKYNEHTFKYFNLENGKEIVICQYKNILLCSFSEKNIIYCLDNNFKNVIQTARTLRRNIHYKTMRSYSKKTNFFAWLQYDLLHKSPENSQDNIDYKKYFTAIAWFYDSNTEKKQAKVVVRTLSGQWQIWLKRYGLTYPALLHPLFKQSQPETLLHFWFNGLSPELIRNLVAWWNKITLDGDDKKVHTDDTVASWSDVFGAQIEIRIDEQKKKEHFSSFIACAQAQVRDSQRLDALLKTMFAGMPQEKRMVGETETTSLLLANGLIRPSYALLRRHLFVADTPEMLAQILSQIENRLITEADQQKSTTSLMALSGERVEWFFLFLKTRELSQRLLTILHILSIEPQRGGKALSVQNRQQIRHVVIPFLTTLQTVETIGLRAALSGDDLIFDITIKPFVKPVE